MTTFQQARAFLLQHRTDYAKAVAEFRWPDPIDFNWALDWFDAELASKPDSRDRTALWIVEAATGNETKHSFAELSRRSNQVANFLRAQGLQRGDHLLLLLGNVVPLWETMLAAIKLGVIVIPATTLLTPEELRDRLDRGAAKLVVAAQDQVAKFDGLGDGSLPRVVVGGGVAPGWTPFEQTADYPETFVPDGPTRPDDPMLLYFTSGTTAKPKLVRHSQRSYPVGALSTMFWLGLQPGDVHLNISSPGWAKHAWSCFFAPWNAGATVFVVNQPRFEAKSLLATMVRCGVTTLCAPPTVWRLFIQEPLAEYKVALREVCGAGEPLNPEVIRWFAEHLAAPIHDHYGQTELGMAVNNHHGLRHTVRPGSAGFAMPGFRVAVLDDESRELPANVPGVLAVDLNRSPLMWFTGYWQQETPAIAGGYYRTGDTVELEADGSVSFVGRADDVITSSGYRIGPFDVESAASRCQPGRIPAGIQSVASGGRPDKIRQRAHAAGSHRLQGCLHPHPVPGRQASRSHRGAHARLASRQRQAQNHHGSSR